MNTQPLVSVIISSYNHCLYIEDSILSVLHQTYPNIELIVVDDGSTDDSPERIKKLQSQYGFDFRVQPNQGLAKTLNDCIARSKGCLIAPLGSDDVMLPERIKTQVEYMQDKPEVGICAGNIETINSKGEAVPKRNHERSFRRLDFEDLFLGKKRGGPAPTLLFRREALEIVGGFDPQVKLEDLLIALKITHSGYFLDVLPDVLAKYRVHGKNTYKNRRFMVDEIMKSYAEFKSHPDYPKVCAGFMNKMLLKCARKDKQLARELLGQLPLRYWNKKTLRAIGRYILGGWSAG